MKKAFMLKVSIPNLVNLCKGKPHTFPMWTDELPQFAGCLAGYESDAHISTEDEYQLRESLPPTIGPTSWQQWKNSLERRIGNSATLNDLGSLGTGESSQRFPVSLSVSSLDEGVILASL